MNCDHEYPRHVHGTVNYPIHQTVRRLLTHTSIPPLGSSSKSSSRFVKSSSSTYLPAILRTPCLPYPSTNIRTATAPSTHTPSTPSTVLLLHLLLPLDGTSLHPCSLHYQPCVISFCHCSLPTSLFLFTSAPKTSFCAHVPKPTHLPSFVIHHSLARSLNTFPT